MRIKKLLLTLLVAALGCLSAPAQQTNTEAQKQALDVLHEKEAKINAERERQQEKDALKKAKEETARRAKEEKEAAKKAKAIAEANKKEAEKKARLEQEALRKAHEEELAERKVREAQAAKRAKIEAEALKKAKAEEAARKEVEAKAVKEAAAKSKSEQAVRKASEEKAKAEAKAQEKLKEQQLAQSKKQEQEAAKRAEAENKALAKMKADEAARQAKAEKATREAIAKAKAREEATQKLAAKEAAEKTRLAEAETKKAQEREAALRKAQAPSSKANSSATVATIAPSTSTAASKEAKAPEPISRNQAAEVPNVSNNAKANVVYDGELYRIVTVNSADPKAQLAQEKEDRQIAAPKSTQKAKEQETLRKQKAAAEQTARKSEAAVAARTETPALQTIAFKTAAPAEAAPASSALSEESEAQARALEALRRKQAELDSLESKIKAEAAQSAPQNERSTGFFKKKPAVSDEDVRAKAIETVRQNDAQKTLQAAPAVKASTPTAPAVNAEAIAALKKANAEVQAIQQKLAAINNDQAAVKKDLAAAQEKAKTAGATTGKNGVEIIVDNAQAKKTGDWIEGKSGGFYGKDYLFKGKGNGSSSLLFEPDFPVAGDYEVYEWHVAGGNRASDAPYIVTSANGAKTIPVDQQLNGAQWNLLGTFHFDAGKSGSVRVTDTISIQGQMVMADAVRFLLAGSGQKSGNAVADSKANEAVEQLQAKQEQLNKEAARLKNQLKSAEKRVAEVKNATGVNVPTSSSAAAAPETELTVQERALQALRQKEAELASQSQAAKTSQSKTATVKSSKTASATNAQPERPLTEKEQKLADLLRRYKNDEIGPREYHQQRSKIIAEP